jgi:hypothetical protein
MAGKDYTSTCDNVARLGGKRHICMQIGSRQKARAEMRAVWAVGMVIAIVACYRVPEVQPRPVRELGEYSFRINGTSVYGKFTILADEVTVEAREHSCRWVDAAVTRGSTYTFRCPDGSAAFTVVVNAASPLMSGWRTATPVKKTTEICMVRETTEAGPVCTKSRTKVTTDSVRDRGRLDVTRIASADRP